jgi:hypothetical protein
MSTPGTPSTAHRPDERPNLARRALMEAIGAFALVTAGCGAIVTTETSLDGERPVRLPA